MIKYYIGKIMTDKIYVHNFSKQLCGRFPSDSKYCGENFREQVLFPALSKGKVILNFDNIDGIASSWLYEVFSNITKKYNLIYIKDNLTIECKDDDSIPIEIWEYIQY